MSDQEIATLGFWAKYANLCIRKKICPLRCILKHLKGPILTCPVEYIRAAHCSCVNAAMASDNSLTTISFFSDIYLKDKTLYEDFYHETTQHKRSCPLPLSLSQGNLLNMCNSLGSCLKTSQQLTVLKLENLPLSFDHVKLLAAGLPETTCLQVLSLAGCPIGDEAVKLLLGNMKRVFSVQWVNFSSCKIAVKGIEAIAEILKFQSVIRRTEIWQHSLRYRKPDLEDFKGLDRISLSDNSGINDESIKILLEPLTNDLWLKALDLQKCNITTVGAADLLNVLTKNCIMQVLDLRLNNAIDGSLLQQIAEQLAANNAGKTLKYEPLPLISKPSLKRKKVFLKPAASLKIKVTSRRPCFRGMKSRKKDSSQRLTQVKTSEQQTEEEFGSALGDMQNIRAQLLDESAVVIASLGKKIEDLKRDLNEEQETRLTIWKKLQEVETENAALKEQLQSRNAPEGFVLIDSETCVQIQETFQKFSNFLALLNEAGYVTFLELLNAVGLKNFGSSPIREHIVHLQPSNTEFGAYQSIHYLPQAGSLPSQNKVPVAKDDSSLRLNRPTDDIHLEHQGIRATFTEISQVHHEQHKPIPAKLLCLQDKVHFVKFGDGLPSSVESSHSHHKQHVSAPENLQGKVPILKLRDGVPNTAVQDKEGKSNVQANIQSNRKKSSSNAACALSSASTNSLVSENSEKRHISEHSSGTALCAEVKSNGSQSKTESEDSPCNSVGTEKGPAKSKKSSGSLPASCGAHSTVIPSSSKSIKKSHSETQIVKVSNQKLSVGSHVDVCKSKCIKSHDVDPRKLSQTATAPPAAHHSSKSDSSSDTGPSSKVSNKRAKNSVTSTASSKSSSRSKVKSASNQKGNSSSSESIYTEVASAVSSNSGRDVRSKGKNKKS